MKIDKKIIALVFSVAAVTAIAYFGFQNTGLAVLPQSGAEVADDIVQKETAGQEETTQITARQAQALTHELSFEVVRPTTLVAKMVEGKAQSCPQESTLRFEVKNSGENKAERVFYSTQNFLVSKCRGCKAKEILSKQNLDIYITGCAESQNAYIQFSSVNAQKETVKIR